MGQLSTYLTQCGRLLHDPNNQFWGQPELTDYINLARREICQETYCLRQLATGISLTAGVEQYPIATTLPVGIAPYVIGIIGMDLYWGNTRYPLTYAPWSVFSFRLRFWVNLQQRPVTFTRQGANTVYVGPLPDQNYVTDWDVALNPADLVSDSSIESIPQPFQDAVQFRACYWAKFKEQAMGECSIFDAEYRKKLLQAQRAFQLFVANPMPTGYNSSV